MSVPSQSQPLLPPSSAPSAKPKKRYLTPARIAMLAFVLAAVVVMFLEGRARWQFSATCRAIDRAIEADDSGGEALYRTDLDRLLHGSPIRKAAAYSESFTWRGVFRSYRMKLRYDRRGSVDGIDTAE